MSSQDATAKRRRQARTLADRLIRFGLLPLDQIARQIAPRIGEPDDLDEAVLASIVADAWKDLRLGATSADKLTALERLSRVYATLESDGVMARHYPVTARSEAHDLIARELASAARSGQKREGFCFYDQFSVREMWHGGLTFCFGSAETLPTHARLWTKQQAVGQKIASALTECGFDVSWDGSPASLIAVHDVSWTGPRTDDGDPIVKIGPLLDVTSAPIATAGRRPTNVLVCGPDHSDLAHRLIARVAEVEARASFAETGSFESASAAADYVASDDRLFDLVAPPADPRRIASRRNLAEEASVLVVIAASTEAARQCLWWADFPPRARVVAAIAPFAATRDVDGSPVAPIALDGDLAALFGALEVARRR